MSDENDSSVAKKRRLNEDENSTSASDKGDANNGLDSEGVGQEEIDQLRQFDVLDEVKGDDSSDDEGSKGKSFRDACNQIHD